MSKDKEHMDKAIQDKLLQAEVSPPAHSWNAIEASLDAASTSKPVLYYVRYVAAAALVGLLITVGVFQLRKPEKQPDIMTIVDQDTIDLKEVVQDSSLKQHIETKVLIPTESGLQEKTNFATVVKPTDKKRKSEEKPPPKLETMMSFMDGIYKTSTIALNKLIFDLPDRNKVKSAEELYKEYLAINDELFKEDESARDETDKFSSIEFGYGSVLSAFNSGSGSLVSDAGGGSDYNESLYSINNSNKPEERLKSISLGINFNYRISKRLSIQSGLGYYKQGQAINNLSVFAISGLQNSSFNNGNWSSGIAANSQNGNILIKQSDFLIANSRNQGQAEIAGISGNLYNFDLSQYFEYLEIPLITAYTILDKRFKFTLLAGLNTGILIGNNVYINDDESVSIGSTEAMNTFVYKGIMGFALDYPIFKQIHLFISPTYRYQLNKSNKNVESIPNRSYFDFKTGLSYWF